MSILKTCYSRLQSVYYGLFGSSELKKIIAKVYGGDILSRVISIGTTIMIIRGLTVNDYAAFTAFYTVLLLIPGLIGNGVNMALVRFSAEYISREEKKPLELYFVSFVFQIVLYSILGAVLFLFSGSVSNLFFGQKDFDIALKLGLAGGLGFLISQAGRGVYNAEERFGHYIKALWLRQVLTLLAVGILYVTGWLTYKMTAVVVIAVELGIAGIILVHIFREIDMISIRHFFREKADTIKEFIAPTRWLIAYFFVLACFQRLDIFMLSHFSTEKELASYGVAFRYYSLAMMLLTSIHAVLLPRFSRADMQDSENQRQFTVKWLKATWWLFIPVLVVALIGKPAFVFINGVQYDDAFGIFIILFIGVWLSLMFSPLVNVLISCKDFRFLFTLGVTAALLNFAGNYLLIPVWGGVGAAVVAILSHQIINIAAAVKVFYSIN